MLILVPIRATDKKQIEAKYKVLKKVLKNDFEIGFEIFTFLDDLDKQEEQVKNLKDYKDCKFIIHAPVPRSDKELERIKYFDLTNKGGQTTLERTIGLANSLDTNLVVVHSNSIYSPEQRKKIPNTDKFKKIKMQEVIKNILEIIDKTDTKIAIENCTPIIYHRPESIFKREIFYYDPCFVYPEDFNLIPKNKNIGVAFDTAHLAITKAAHNYCPNLFPDVMSISKFTESLIKKNLLFHCHLSDLIIDKKGFIKEGEIPGTGLIKEDEFKKTLSYLEKFTLEIRDFPHHKPIKLEKSLKIIKNWLNQNV